MTTTRVSDLIVITANLTGLSIGDIKGKRRNRIFVRARHAICYVAHKQGVHSYPHIGRALGGRDHSTIIHGAKNAVNMAARDPSFRTLLENIEATANAADPWVKQYRNFYGPVSVEVKFDVPRVLRPLFDEPPQESDNMVRHNAMIAKGSAALLKALQG